MPETTAAGGRLIIDHLRIGEPKATDFLKQIEDGKIQAFISVITEYELLAVKKLTDRQQFVIKKLFSILPSISITSNIVLQAVKFHQAHQTGMADGLIAGTAYIHKATIVSRDKIFFKIKGITAKSI